MDYLDLYLIHWPMSFKVDARGIPMTDSNGRKVLSDVPIEDTWRTLNVMPFEYSEFSDCLEIERDWQDFIHWSI